MDNVQVSKAAVCYLVKRDYTLIKKMPTLSQQKKLFNSKYVTMTRPKRWTRDPIIKKKHQQKKVKKKVKRKKAKVHTVRAYKRGGFLPHGADFVGGTHSSHQSQNVFQGNHNTYYKTRIPVHKRRIVDFRGRLAMKSGNHIG